MQINKQHKWSVKKKRNEYDHPPNKQQMDQNKANMIASENINKQQLYIQRQKKWR